MQKIIVISGATAVGKSNLALNLAQNFNGEIIGADSMQIYKGMDIGTSKTPQNERKNIPHHLIDIINPNQNFSVAEYTTLAKKTITQVINSNKLPIIVGGTGLYLTSLLLDFSFANSTSNEQIRTQLKQKQNDELHQTLKEIDPISAQKISINDTKRLIRALEIFYTTGIPKSQHNDILTPNYDYLLLNLTLERKKMYQKIESRVDQMINAGLIDEAKTIYNSLKNSKIPLENLQSIKAIGYKEIIPYLNKQCTLNQAIDAIKMNTRRYAKRQVTYFKNMPLLAHTFDLDDPQTNQNIINKIISFLNQKDSHE